MWPRPTLPILTAAIACIAAAPCLAQGAMASEITIGIGTQDTTTNTVGTGAVIRRLGLLERYLPTTGPYAGVKYSLDWQNFTSGPPVTNGMMAGKLQFGAMGDYPLLVNGFTFASNPQSRSELVAVAGYNLSGAGNGVLVNSKSSYFELADLRGKVVSVPFGSAAHGMLLQAIGDRGWPADAMRLVNQSPEIGATNLQEQKIDGHADFVPYAELMPFRGFARKIFDGAQTGKPTWHGVVVRTDFSKKHPAIVEAYVKAIVAANAWIREDPVRAARQIQAWTGTDKEVVYIFLGPGGLMTLDPTLKPQLLAAAEGNAEVLRKLGRMGEFSIPGWSNDAYIRKAYAELGLDYDALRDGTDNYEVSGQDGFCNRPVTEPRKAGEIWVEPEGVRPYSSATCTLGALAQLRAAGSPVAAAYVFDSGRGLKLFADKATYVLAGEVLHPFLLRADAEAFASASGGRVLAFDDALRAAAAKG